MCNLVGQVAVVLSHRGQWGWMETVQRTNTSSWQNMTICMWCKYSTIIWLLFSINAQTPCGILDIWLKFFAWHLIILHVQFKHYDYDMWHLIWYLLYYYIISIYMDHSILLLTIMTCGIPTCNGWTPHGNLWVLHIFILCVI